LRKSKTLTRIENVVASASLNQTIDLSSIARAFPQIEYRPGLFPGLVFRLKKPKTTTLIFGTGRMVCTGAKSEKDSRRALNKLVEELRTHGIPISNIPSIKIQNIVASVILGGTIDLENAVSKLKRVMYEPEQFPAAIYRMEDPNVVFLIFSTGKSVCVGAKREREVYEAVEKLQRILEENKLIFDPE
jgi:transcription initiation factor TFIID TATA-box-binding protein